MPFDGSSRIKVIKAVRILDEMEKLFDGGKGWLQDDWDNGRDQRCLVGQLNYVRRKNHIKGDGTGRFLRRAIRQLTKGDYTAVINFNDTFGRKYSEIEAVIHRARELASKEC